MSRTTIKMENVTLRYPRQRVTMGPIGKSLKSLLKIHRHTTDYFTALRNITLGVKEGEVLGLIGHNGAGKSTMLRLISGIYRPDEGTVKSSGNISLLAGLGVGFNVNLSGRENIYLYGSILGHSRQMMDTLTESIIEFSGLEKFIDQPLRTFSSGMRARLGFSVASAIEPDILLIDEVLGVGDSEFQEKSLARIQQMVGNARTVVIVSHSTEIIKQICNRLVLVQNGQIAAVGTPNYVIEAYKDGISHTDPMAKQVSRLLATGNPDDEKNALINASKEWGYSSGAIRTRKDLWHGKNILDVGMGAGPHATSFIEGGCKSYTGVDPLVGTERVRDFQSLDNDSIPAYHAFPFTTDDIMRIYPNVRLYSSLLENVVEEIKAHKIDVVLMAAVTEHLADPHNVFRSIWEIMDEGGVLWFSHCNYYSWTGHHAPPRSVAEWDGNSPEQDSFTDWKHLDTSYQCYWDENFNRIRLNDLRDLVNKYFEIIEWNESVEAYERLTPEIRKKWKKYTLSELLGQNIYVSAKRRKVPLDTDLSGRQFHHPDEEYLADVDYSSEEIEPFKYYNSVYFSSASEVCSHSNNDFAGIKLFNLLKPRDKITLKKFTETLELTVSEVYTPTEGNTRIRVDEEISEDIKSENHDQWTITNY